jgi:hypothetical protein
LAGLPVLLVILTRSGLAGGAVFFASLFSLIMDSERELLAAKAELRELEAHDLYGTWQARRFDDDLGEGLRNFGATLHSAKDRVQILTMHVEGAKAAAAVPGALAARQASEQEKADRLLGALPINKRGFEFLDKDKKPHVGRKRMAEYLNKIALPVAEAQELLPAEDSALIAGLGAGHEELRARVVDAGKAVNEGMARIRAYAQDLVIANDKGWTFVDRYRAGKVLDLNDEETKRFNELVKEEDAREREAALVKAASKGDSKKRDRNSGGGYWRSRGRDYREDSRDYRDRDRSDGPYPRSDPPRFGARYNNRGDKRASGGRG